MCVCGVSGGAVLYGDGWLGESGGAVLNGDGLDGDAGGKCCKDCGWWESSLTQVWTRPPYSETSAWRVIHRSLLH